MTGKRAGRLPRVIEKVACKQRMLNHLSVTCGFSIHVPVYVESFLIHFLSLNCLFVLPCSSLHTHAHYPESSIHVRLRT